MSLERFVQYPFVSQSPSVPLIEAFGWSIESFYEEDNFFCSFLLYSFFGCPGLWSLSLLEDLMLLSLQLEMRVVDEVLSFLCLF